MAPTCKVCLIRDDLTTVWCEVTSSIRTRSVEEESPFDALTAELTGTAPPEPSVKSTSDAPPGALKEAAKEETVTELLLCLRPIRDGEKKVAESLRFKREMEEGDQLFQQNSSDGAEFRAAVSSSSGGPQNSSENASSNRSRDPAKRPPKKRPHQAQEAADSDGSADEEQEVMDASPTKKKRNVKQEGAQTPVNASDDTEKSVVESLMLMSNKSQ